jgi:large conductance mechanosensitive channel
MKGFLDFIREQGVVGLAVGFVLGGAVSKFVTAIVIDLVNPVLGLALGTVGGLQNLIIHVGRTKIMVGDFLSNLIDLLVIALIVYISVTKLGLNKLDKKKDS